MTSRAGLILEHAATGPAGRLGAWCELRGIAYRAHRSWEQSPAALDPRDWAFVASLGSARSTNDAEPDWIGEEIALLRRCVEVGTPVLGLCWGGQALARALGAVVSEARFAEKGWLAIVSVDPAIPGGPWLHYHHEVFAVPDGATELARSPAGPAAFRIGPHLGLQFHPEADAEMAAVWAGKDPDETDASRAEIAEQSARWDAGAGELSIALFDAWWASLGAGGDAAGQPGQPSRNAAPASS